MNRGSRVAPHAEVAFAARFNEAPIHESGKSVLHCHTSHLTMGFNEAPIHESGKCDYRIYGAIFINELQ